MPAGSRHISGTWAMGRPERRSRSSALAGDEIRDARRERRADPVEIALLDAADLAERIEQVILPSLRAGLVVLADRYCWTSMARAEARGVDPDWLKRLFAFVPTPDAVLYLDVPPAAASHDARRRSIRTRPAPTWALSDDLVASYRMFQERLYACFERFVAAVRLYPRPGRGERRRDIAARLAHIADRRRGCAPTPNPR